MVTCAEQPFQWQRAQPPRLALQVVAYYEVSHRDARQSVVLDLLVQIANKPAFEILR